MKIAGCWLVVLILGCAGCRSTASSPMPAPDATTTVQVPEPQITDTELPGIGDPPQAGPSARTTEVSDPLEPVNRAFFAFNDKLYFWLLEPVCAGYRYILPQGARRDVNNFFSNVATPIRLVNCALQGEFMDAWVELERFGINTTAGVAGFGDPARHAWGLQKRSGDCGQTLGRYGIEPSIYINWPVIGPLCARDSVGYVGDLCLDPFTYLVPQFWYNVDIKAYDTVNATSLRPGEYEDFKAAALDPYIAFRDAYYQYRRHLVENSGPPEVRPAGPWPAD